MSGPIKSGTLGPVAGGTTSPGRGRGDMHGSWEERDTSEWGKHQLPEILHFIQGWYLFMDSGLDVMERNVLHAELRGDFGVRAVEEGLRKHCTDADLRKRDAEKGRYMSNLAMDEGDEPQGYAAEWSMDELEAEGYSTEEIGAIAQEEETARAAWVAMQDARHTLRDARARQHAVRMHARSETRRQGWRWQPVGADGVVQTGHSLLPLRRSSQDR